MTKRVFIDFIFVILFSLKGYNAAALNEDQQCYSDRTDPYQFFSTKTSYFAVDNENTDEIKFDGCETRSLWLLARHGTRNPGKKDLAKIVRKAGNLRSKILANHAQGQGLLCESDKAGLAAWNLTLSLGEDSMLTESGRSEHFHIGERFKKRLPDLMGKNYQKGKFLFRHTHKSRTEESAKSFAKGSFPGDENEIFDPSENYFVEKDMLLRFYDYCEMWINQVDENEATYEEQKLFLKTNHILSMVSRVANTLGFEDQTLKLEDVVLVYDLCRFEKAWSPEKVSVWCSAFQDEDLMVLEYSEELKYWYNSGYFYNINSMFACPLIKDLVQKFGGENGYFEAKDEAIINATFYFSHSEAVLPFLRLLNLYRDDKQLRHDNYEEMKDRKYRTSKIGPFSSNIAFLLFNCQGKKKVMVLHQEHPIQLEGCPDLLCDWEKFIEIYKEKLKCNFDELCSVDGPHVKNHSLTDDDEDQFTGIETDNKKRLVKQSVSNTASMNLPHLIAIVLLCTLAL